MTVSYLDVQDEITDAVARLRAAGEERVILVLPPGSRIGTSRINFRLLLREARSRGVSLDVVSGEPGVRALAASAGARTFSSVGEAEQQPAVPAHLQTTMGGDGGQEAAGIAAAATPPRGTPLDAVTPDAEATGAFGMAPRGSTTGFGPAGAGSWSVPVAEAPVVARKPRRRYGVGTARLAGRLLVVGAIIAVVGGVAYGAYLELPTATVRVTPETQTFGPMTFAVVADPTVAVPDPASGRIPAQRVPLSVHASNTFDATGTDTTLVPAVGSVRFSNTNSLVEADVPEGTIVSTRDGIEFGTTQAAHLPKAHGTDPSTVDVPVQAVVGGEAGNVAARTITQLPGPLQAFAVTNPDPTTGGTKVDLAAVTMRDYDNAVAALTTQLQGELTSAIADPGNTPLGLTMYPETAALGPVVPDQASDALVGKQVENFMLTADSTGTALAVDQELVRSAAAKQLQDAVPAGVQSFADTIHTDVSPGQVSGDTIKFDVTSTIQQYLAPDHDGLVAAIKGKPVSDARSILAPYGTVDISVWPDFVPTIPDDTRRIDLTIESPQFPEVERH